MASEIGRIESEIILNRIQRLGEKITLQYINSRFDMIVEKIAGKRLIMRRVAPSEEMLLVGRVVQLFFKYQGAEMTILPRVVRDYGEQIELAIEKPAYRDVSRTFERVYNDASIRIMAIDDSETTVPKYPHTIRAISQQKMEKYTEGLPADPPALIQSYFSALEKQGAIAKIILFRENPPAHLAERVAAYLGYPIVIPYPDSSVQNLPIPPRSSIQKVVRKMEPSTSGAVFTERDFIPGFDHKDVQIIVPIIYLSYCVGYVFMATHSLQAEQYETYIRFMERYSYALTTVLGRSGYFADLTRSRETARILRLINISPTGLRFSYKAPQSIYEIGGMARLMISFPWGDVQREFIVDAKIVHVDAYSQLHYASVEFVDPDPALFSLVNDYLYQNKDVAEE